jgi:hypothetical protein
MGHTRTLIAAGLNQPLILEQTQDLAQWGTADTKRASQFFLRDERTGRIDAIQDELTQTCMEGSDTRRRSVLLGGC